MFTFARPVSRCRSGVRSATAAAQLVEMGYKNIYDLGGIKDWPYEKVSGQ